MSRTSRGTDVFKRLPTSLFCLLIVMNYAKATIDYAAFRNDTIAQETKRESARTTRDILEELIHRNITAGDNLQHGTEHLLQYGALLRTQILDAFGKLVYDHYDDFGMRQIEALHRVYRETLERKYNIFDIVPSVLNDPDTRPTKICAHINDHVKTCLDESAKICMNVKIHDEPHQDTLSKEALNVTRDTYDLAEIPTYYPRGFSPPAVLQYIKSGRLRFTPALFSGLLHNAQYDSFDDEVRTAERELVFFLTRASNFSGESEKVSSSARSVGELLRNYLTSGEKIFTGKALRNANYLAEHVIVEVADAISENIEWLGTVYDNSTINLKYLFELILPNDTMDRDILDTRNYLLRRIKDQKIVEKYLRIEKYQQAGPDQLLMEILGQLRDIHFAEDLVTSLYAHARFWHKSRMIRNLYELLELFESYENLRGVPRYRELLENADRIKSDLAHSKNVTVELLCSRPRSCLRIGLEMVKNCSAIDEKTKAAIDQFTNLSCQCSCLEDDSAVFITNGTELDEIIYNDREESSTGNPGDILEIIDDTTTEESLGNSVGLTPRLLEKDSPNDEDEKLGTGSNDEEIPTSTTPTPHISAESSSENITKIPSEPLVAKPCVENCSSSECNSPDCQSQGNATDIQCEGSDCNETHCEGPECMQTNCKPGNCTTDSNEVDRGASSNCEGEFCEENSTSQSDCEAPDCSTVSCEGEDCPPDTCIGNHCKVNAISCEGLDCSNNNCTDPNCTINQCESSNCVNNPTGDCNGTNCPHINCIGSDCPEHISMTTCTTDCPSLASEQKPNCEDINCCEGGNCDKISSEKVTANNSIEDPIGDKCEGENCENDLKKLCEGTECSAELTASSSENDITVEPCVADNCTTFTPTVEDNCGGANCTDNSTKEESNEIQGEGNCEDCQKNGTKICEGDECIDRLSKEGDEQIDEEPCLGDNCTIVSTTLEVDCQGVNCTSNSTEIDLENIENKENCQNGHCERSAKKPCEDGECIYELPEGKGKTITEIACNEENCTLSTFPPDKESQEIHVSAEPSVELASTPPPKVKRISTFCGNRDPHYRRRRNRLRKMRRIDALNPTYQGWNNIISSSVIEKNSSKANKDSNINVNENSNININKNSHIDVNDDSKNPLLQVLGNTKSIFLNSKMKEKSGRKNAELAEKEDKTMKFERSKKNKSDHLAIEEMDEEAKSRKLRRQKKMKQSKNEHKGLRTIERANSEVSSLSKSRESQDEEDELEEGTKKDQERLNLRTTKKAATKKEKMMGREEKSKEKIEEEIKTKSKKLEKVKNDTTTTIANDKLSKNRRKQKLKTRWHKLGSKVSLEKNNEEKEEAMETNLNKLERSMDKTHKKSLSNDKSSEKQRTKKSRTRWHNYKNTVEKNQRRTATKFTHERDDNESVSDDEIADKEELEEEAETNSLESQKTWKTMNDRGNSTESREKTTNEGKAQVKKSKNKMKTESEKIHIPNEKHGWGEIRRNDSAKHEEKEAEEEDIQDDSENLQNRWKTIKKERAEDEKNVNRKTKLKSHNGWHGSHRKNSTMMKKLPEENSSESYEDDSFEEILSRQGVVKSKSKMSRDYRKRPTRWIEKRRMKTKHSSHGGHTWRKKTLRAKELGTHREEPTVPRALD